MTATSLRRSVTEDLRAALPAWVVARVLVAIAYGIARLWRAHSHPGELTIQLHQGLFAWDGAFYRDIATKGYGSLPEAALRFFPLYPLSGRGLGWVLGGNEGLALLLVANVGALVAAALIHRLVILDLADRRTAVLSASLLALAPPAFVLVWAYAEALYLVCAIGMFIALRRRSWWWAALLGFLAGLARPFGVVLAVPAAIEALKGWKRATTRDRVARAAAIVAPVVGLATFLLWIGNLDPIHQQGELRGQWLDPVRGLSRAVGDLFGSQRFLDGLHAPFAIALVVLVVLCIRWLPPSYTAYAAIVVLSALSASNLNSLERYGLNAFPVVIAMAMLARRWRIELPTLIVSSVPHGGDVQRRLARPLRPLTLATGATRVTGLRGRRWGRGVGGGRGGAGRRRP